MLSAIAVPSARDIPEAARAWIMPVLLGLGVYVLCVVFARALLGDGDTLMHIVIGRWIIEHRAIPFHDPFSFTAHGQTWVPHEWLSEVVFAGVYDHLGWGGVVAVTAISAAAAFALLTRALETPLGARRAAIGTALALLLAMGHVLARPHALAWPLMVIWMTQIIRARDARHIPSLALLPVMVLWCNLHGGFVIGLGFAGLLAIEAVADAAAATRFRVVAGWAVFLVLAAASALISPNGFDAYLLPLKMLHMPFAISHISEWQGLDFSHFQPLEIWLGLAIAGGYMAGIRLPASRLAMVLLLLYAALTHRRNQELLGIMTPLLLAAPLAAQLRPVGLAQAVATALPRNRRMLPLCATGLVLSLTIAFAFYTTALSLDRRGLEPDGNGAPVAAIEAARAAGLSGPVLNSYRFGGYLVFVGISPFVDGRADLFGDAFLKRFATAVSGNGDLLPGLLDEYAIEWAIFEPLDPAVTLVSHLPGWQRIYTDKYAVVLRRSRTAAEASSNASARSSAEAPAATAAAGDAQPKR